MDHPARGAGCAGGQDGALIGPLAIRRMENGVFRIEAYPVFEVPSSDPADLQRATQRIADFLETAIRAAPQQWYSFKPMWPDDPGEARQLEARAATMLAGRRATAPPTDGDQAPRTDGDQAPRT